MYIGIDLVGTNIAAGVVTEKGRIVSGGELCSGRKRGCWEAE